MKPRWPSLAEFSAVCKNGLSVIRPLLPEARSQDEFGWNFLRAAPPSYQAYGRLRALSTLNQVIEMRPRSMLEIAANDASLCASLQSRLGSRVVANDLREDELRKGVRLYSNRDSIIIAPGNVFDLDPEITGNFDLVVACELIEHVAHPLDLLRHLRRFLTEDGYLLLTTPNGGYFRNKLPSYSEISEPAALEAQQFKPDADGHLFLITPSELRQMAVEAGFSIRRLDLWATPVITGHCGFRRLAQLGWASPWYLTESAIRVVFPRWALTKLCFGMSAVLQ